LNPEVYVKHSGTINRKVKPNHKVIMQKIRAYIQDSYNELMNKVSWPTWNELQSSALVVLVASLIIGLMVFGMDSVFQLIMNLLYSTF
jgi:preprotein translocase subunit SecE